MRYRDREERAFLLSDLGFRADLGDDFEGARRAHGLGSSAHAFLTTSVRCLLVGLPVPAHELLKKAEHWLGVAIHEKERPSHYFEHGTEAQRFRTLSLCRWLLRSEHDRDSLGSFVLHEDQFLATSASRKDPLTIRLVLAGYVDADARERVLELVRRIKPEPTASGRSANREEDVARLICQSRIAQATSQEAKALFEGFIADNVEAWLTRGHAVRLAEWAKILYWREGEDEVSPEQALKKPLTLMK